MSHLIILLCFNCFYWRRNYYYCCSNYNYYCCYYSCLLLFLLTRRHIIVIWFFILLLLLNSCNNTWFMLLKLLLLQVIDVYVEPHNIYECKYMMYYYTNVKSYRNDNLKRWYDICLFVPAVFIDNSNWDMMICLFINVRMCWQRTMHGDCCIHLSLYDYDIHTVYRR